MTTSEQSSPNQPARPATAPLNDQLPARELIALIGPRGSGKTTVAQILAHRLGWDWVDADDRLEKTAGRSIRSIFAEHGEAGFRAREAAILAELCGLSRHVIATGGGAVLLEENRVLLRNSTCVVWLSADVGTLCERLETDVTTAERRPALLGGGRSEVEEVLRTREPLYRACSDWSVETAARTPEDVAAAIAETYARRFGRSHEN